MTVSHRTLIIPFSLFPLSPPRLLRGFTCVRPWLPFRSPLQCADATPPTHAQVSADNPATSEPSANTDASGAGESKEAALASEAKWLSANVPKLGRAKVLIEVDARIGGPDVTVAKVRASSPKIDKCVMTLDEVFERDEVGNTTGEPTSARSCCWRTPTRHRSRFSRGGQARRASASSAVSRGG
jgi:hypothetical protein